MIFAIISILQQSKLDFRGKEAVNIFVYLFYLFVKTSLPAEFTYETEGHSLFFFVIMSQKSNRSEYVVSHFRLTVSVTEKTKEPNLSDWSLSHTYNNR